MVAVLEGAWQSPDGGRAEERRVSMPMMRKFFKRDIACYVSI
jgi:hypothetical protein